MTIDISCKAVIEIALAGTIAAIDTKPAVNMITVTATIAITTSCCIGTDTMATVTMTTSITTSSKIASTRKSTYMPCTTILAGKVHAAPHPVISQFVTTHLSPPSSTSTLNTS